VVSKLLLGRLDGIFVKKRDMNKKRKKRLLHL